MHCKTTYNTIVSCSDSITLLGNTKNISGSTILKIRKIVKVFIDELKIYEDLVNEKIKEFGVVDESTGKTIVKTDSPHYKEVIDFINDLSNTEIEINVNCESIDIKEIIKIDPCPLSAYDLDNLISLKIIKDEDEEDVKEKIEKTSDKKDISEDVEVEQEEASK